MQVRKNGRMAGSAQQVSAHRRHYGYRKSETEKQLNPKCDSTAILTAVAAPAPHGHGRRTVRTPRGWARPREGRGCRTHCPSTSPTPGATRAVEASFLSGGCVQPVPWGLMDSKGRRHRRSRAQRRPRRGLQPSC